MNSQCCIHRCSDPVHTLVSFTFAEHSAVSRQSRGKVYRVHGYCQKHVGRIVRHADEDRKRGLVNV